MARRLFSCLLLALGATILGPVAPAGAQTSVLCTLVVEAVSGATLRRAGDCAGRVTPASTFKIAISLMGFDAGILRGGDDPHWPFKPGYADWQPDWRQAQTPTMWMRLSVVWYSQEITKRLGAARFAAGVKALGYGNGDVSGDPGKDNGLARAWLSSSLQISPAEQVVFLRRLLTCDLPVTPAACVATKMLLEQSDRPDGWRVFGKTGSGAPRQADGTLARGRSYGWFVGWAEKDGRMIVFARLTQDGGRPEAPQGPRARAALMAELFGGGD